ncbi:MAG TPA: hypothetical protein VEU47_14505 [Candidatus Cybelea sp.]|nr:hypothetical protein [Candidatus Cybelea sp.]
MNRRQFSVAALTFSAGLAARAAPAHAAVRRIRVKVEPARAGARIPSDFLGLSYESGELPHADFFSARNRSMVSLIRGLGPNGMIRIGGNSSERTLFRSEGGRDIKQPRTTFAPADVDRLAGFMDAIGWKLVWGLNLATGTPDDAAREAAYVMRRLGKRLAAFQIGNEPDLLGGDGRPRPNGYGVADYLREWRTFVSAVRARVPDARFAGPDVAARIDWLKPFAEDAAKDLAMLTYHYYDEGPAEDPKVSIARLLAPDPAFARGLEEMSKLARGYRLPFRLIETNSVYNGGRFGVSDTLAAGIWGLDLMFREAAAGSAGVNFHAGRHRSYSPIAQPSPLDPYGARPLYHAMRLFGETARGRMVDCTVRADGINVAAYACRSDDGTIRVILVNKDLRQDASVILDAGTRSARAPVRRLTGRGPSAIDGVSIIDDLPLSRSHNTFIADVPLCSAAVVTFVE